MYSFNQEQGKNKNISSSVLVNVCGVKHIIDHHSPISPVIFIFILTLPFEAWIMNQCDVRNDFVERLLKQTAMTVVRENVTLTCTSRVMFMPRIERENVTLTCSSCIYLLSSCLIVLSLFKFITFMYARSTLHEEQETHKKKKHNSKSSSGDPPHPFSNMSTNYEYSAQSYTNTLSLSIIHRIRTRAIFFF